MRNDIAPKRASGMNSLEDDVLHRPVDHTKGHDGLALSDTGHHIACNNHDDDDNDVDDVVDGNKH